MVVLGIWRRGWAMLLRRKSEFLSLPLSTWLCFRGWVLTVRRRYVGTLTTKPDEDLYERVYETWQGIVKDLPEGAVLHYTIQPVGSKAVEYGRQQGGNVMNLQAEPQVCTFPLPMPLLSPISNSSPSMMLTIPNRVGIHSRMALTHRRPTPHIRRGHHRSASYIPRKGKRCTT